MKIAVVCDWLVTYAGAEKVLEQILALYPEADIFSVVDFIPNGARKFLMDKSVNTTFIQRLPGAKKHYRSYLPLMPLAIEQLDLTGYDLVISNSHCVAKGVLTGPNQLHIAYVHSPMRYAWDLQHQYLKEAGMERGAKSWMARLILHYMRLWDSRTANGVDYFFANSRFIAQRIKKVYGRDAEIVYPPVDTEKFTLRAEKENFYLTASRLVPYKKVRLIVEAFGHMPDKRLIVIGDGPEMERIRKTAGENVQLFGYRPDEILKDYMQRAKAFIFAAEEDFGIVPVEAQACGTPVIAFGRGGALETVADGETGLFFCEQSAEKICEATARFEKHEAFSPEACRRNAERFSVERFRARFQKLVGERIEAFARGPRPLS